MYPALVNGNPLKKEIPNSLGLAKVEVPKQLPTEISLANVPRIPSLTTMDSCLAQSTREDSNRQSESNHWDSFQSGWADAPNVWNDSSNDIPGSIMHLFDEMMSSSK